MGVRTSMSQIITRVRFLINDPSGGSAHFADQDIQDSCDSRRYDNWYELLEPALTVVNSTGTSNTVGVIWADYYSRYGAPLEVYWESDATLLGNNVSTGANWVVITPVTSDYIVGHWQFELNQFTTATVPGQYPPVFIWGKIYDLNRICADLMETWASSYVTQFNFTSDGQTFNRSQIFQMMMARAKAFRAKAMPMNARAYRSDYPTPAYSTSTPILGDVNGDWSKP